MVANEQRQHLMAKDIYINHLDLISKWLRYAQRRYPALKFFPDLESHIVEALWRAAIAFKPHLGAQFSTFAHYRVRGSIIDLVRKQCRSRDSLDQPHRLRAKPESFESLSSPNTPTPEDRAQTLLQLKRLMDRAKGSVPKESIFIIWDHCVLEKSLRSIARERGKSYHQVRTQYLRAISMLSQRRSGKTA